MKYIRLMAWKELMQIRNDPLMVRLMIFPVLIQLFVIGYALTTEVRRVPVAVLDRSNTPESRSLTQVLEHSDRFVFRGGVRDENEIRSLLDQGEIKLALIFPYDFASRIKLKEGSPLQLLSDGQDANSSTVAAGYATTAISGWVFQMLKRDLAAQGMDIRVLLPVSVSITILFNPMLKSSWYMLPALVVLLVTIITALLTGFSIVKEKERGTFEQLMVTPISPFHLVFGKALPFVAVGLGEIAVFLVIALFWFQLPFRGSIPTLFLFGLVYMFSSLGIGIFTSTIARSSQQVMFLIWFILIFFLLLSGLFVPVENMPSWVQKVTWINPLRYFMLIVREMFLKGSGFRELWLDGLHLLLIGIGMFGMSLLAFKRKLG